MSAARLGIRHVSLLGTISARRMVRRAAAPKPCGSRREHHMRLLAQRERRALKPSLPFTLMLRLKPAPPFTLMLRLGRSQGSCQDGPRNSYLPGRGDTMITKGVSHERSTSRHPPRVPPWHNQRTENGQEGCSSKALRKQERAPHAPPRSARKAGPGGPGRALKPSLPFTLMLRLKPAPPFTLMLRLGRSQGSCQDGPRNSYLPGRGDTMITKVVHPGRGSAIALGWC
ncbi:hypothetical protein AOLI_G00188120 [Acnodon oligacanthus]